MKIHYISGSIFPSEVSHTLSKMRMCQAFSNEGYNILLTGLDAGLNLDPIEFYGLKGGFEIKLQKRNKFLKYKFFNKFRIQAFINAYFHLKHVNQFKPDIIYSRLTIIELLFLPRNIPIIYEMHSLGPFGKGIVASAIFKFVLKFKNFKKIIVSSNILNNMLKKHIINIPIITARLSAENPVEIDKNELEVFKRDFLLGENFKSHVGYTGYLDTVGLRGTDIICKVASKMPNIAFHIVGGKPEIVDYWKKYAEDFNFNHNIFFYGHKNPSTIPFFLNCFDVVLAPLQFRPQTRAPTGANMSPLKLPQYMAYKKAMIVSDLIAHQEILTHDRTALFVKFDDVDAWKASIEKLLLSPDKRIQMGEACFNEYLKYFTPEGRVKIILNNKIDD